MKEFYAFMTKYFPEGDKLDGGTVVGYTSRRPWSRC